MIHIQNSSRNIEQWKIYKQYSGKYLKKILTNISGKYLANFSGKYLIETHKQQYNKIGKGVNTKHLLVAYHKCIRYIGYCCKRSSVRLILMQQMIPKIRKTRQNKRFLYQNKSNITITILLLYCLYIYGNIYTTKRKRGNTRWYIANTWPIRRIGKRGTSVKYILIRLLVLYLVHYIVISAMAISGQQVSYGVDIATHLLHI